MEGSIAYGGASGKERFCEKFRGGQEQGQEGEAVYSGKVAAVVMVNFVETPFVDN